MSDLFTSMAISSSGMRAQSERTRVISENVANADNTPDRPGVDPYARKTITFKNMMDKEIGAHKVAVDKIDRDTKTPFPVKYMPGHPAAEMPHRLARRSSRNTRRARTAHRPADRR